MRDIVVHNHGSIFLLAAVTPAGEAWMAEHLPEDAPTFGKAVAVEHRFVDAIIDGATTDGLEVW